MKLLLFNTMQIKPYDESVTKTVGLPWGPAPVASIPDTGPGFTAVAGIDGPYDIRPVGARGRHVMDGLAALQALKLYTPEFGIKSDTRTKTREAELRFAQVMAVRRWTPLPDGTYLSPNILGRNAPIGVGHSDRDANGVLFRDHFRNELANVRVSLGQGAKYTWSVYLVMTPVDPTGIRVHCTALVQRVVGNWLQYHYYEPLATDQRQSTVLPEFLVHSLRAMIGQKWSVLVRRTNGSQRTPGSSYRRCLIFIANFLDDQTVLNAYNWSPYDLVP